MKSSMKEIFKVKGSSAKISKLFELLNQEEWLPNCLEKLLQRMEDVEEASVKMDLVDHPNTEDIIESGKVREITVTDKVWISKGKYFTVGIDINNELLVNIHGDMSRGLVSVLLKKGLPIHMQEGDDPKGYWIKKALQRVIFNTKNYC